MSTTLPILSAIVSVYNAERFLPGCLEDLERQTIASELEIIVVDSGSSQGEGLIVSAYQERFSNIRYIRTEQRETIYEAWNRAIALAKGKYLTNANADDRHRPDAFERLVRALESDTGAAVAYADCNVTETENDTWESGNTVGVFHWPKYDRSLLFNICFIGPQPVWRRDVHERHGLFDGKLRSAGDYEFWLRLAAAGERFVHVPEVLGLYLASPSGMELSNQGLSHTEAQRAREDHWQRKWGKLPHGSPSFFFPPLAENPLVSIVVATQNRPALLEHALQSVIGQTYDNLDVIVVNDGGADVSEIVGRIDHYGRIRLLDHWQPLGQACARNTALRLARGEIICYLDDDDIFKPTHVEGVVAAMKQTGSPFVFTDATKILEHLEGQDRIELSRTSIDQESSDPNERLLAWNFIPLPTWAHRRECIPHVGFFDESMRSHEDWDFLLRFSKLWQLIHLSRNTVEIRVRQATIDSVTSRHAGRTVDDFLRVYGKHATTDARIESIRRQALESLGYVSTPVGRTIRGLRRAFSRYIGWRFTARLRSDS